MKNYQNALEILEQQYDELIFHIERSKIEYCIALCHKNTKEKSLEKALNHINNAIESSPQVFKYHIMKADIFWDNKAYLEAQQQYINSEKFAHTDLQKQTYQKRINYISNFAQKIYEKGVKELNEGHFLSAIDKFDIAEHLQQNKKDENLLFNIYTQRAQAYLDSKNYEQVIKEIEKAEIIKQNDKTLYLKGIALKNLEQFDEGIQNLEKIVDQTQFIESQIEQSRIYKNFQKIKPWEQLFQEIRELNQENPKMSNLFKENGQIYQNFEEFYQNKENYQNWTQNQIKNWATNTKKERNFIQNLPESLGIISRAVKLISGFPPRDIQIIAILQFLLSKGKTLCQILTGEGKSWILAILAISYVLQGHKVDIITSNIILAQRDSKDKNCFFKLFNSDCNHNHIEKLEDMDQITKIQKYQDIYDSDIVYGDVHQFSVDILFQEYFNQKRRGDRKFDKILVDEVDSMLIDQKTKKTYISSNFEGSNQILLVMQYIWVDLQQLLQNNQITKENTVKDTQEQLDLKIYLLGSTLKFIEGLDYEQYKLDYLISQLYKWIENAIHALQNLEKDVHYRVVDSKIVTVDYKDTGVSSSQSMYSNGLHQFLQMKEKLEITEPSLMTNYLSNIGFFSRYNFDIIGISGTLGSQSVRIWLKKGYNLDLLYIPPFKPRILQELEGKMVCSQYEWCQQISEDIQTEAIKNKRIVLVINQTIQSMNVLYSYLENSDKFNLDNIFKYFDSMDQKQQETLIKFDQPGNIILATNLAGRGTDIIPSIEVENNGGLHVIVSFLPYNQRVEQQAFGRSGRQGKKGTCRLIVNLKDEFGDKQYLNLKKQISKQDKTNFSVQMLKNKRDERENNFMEQSINTIDNLLLQDEIFKKQIEMLEMYGIIDQQQDQQLEEIQERFGMFMQIYDLQEIKQAKINKIELEKNFQFYTESVQKDYNQQKLGNNNPYYLLRKVTDLIKDEQLQESMQKLKTIENIDPKNPITFYYQGCILLKQQNLKEAKKQFEISMSNLQKSVSQYKQLQQKMNINVYKTYYPQNQNNNSNNNNNNYKIFDNIENYNKKHTMVQTALQNNIENILQQLNLDQQENDINIEFNQSLHFIANKKDLDTKKIQEIFHEQGLTIMATLKAKQFQFQGQITSIFQKLITILVETIINSGNTDLLRNFGIYPLIQAVKDLSLEFKDLEDQKLNMDILLQGGVIEMLIKCSTAGISLLNQQFYLKDNGFEYTQKKQEQIHEKLKTPQFLKYGFQQAWVSLFSSSDHNIINIKQEVQLDFQNSKQYQDFISKVQIQLAESQTLQQLHKKKDWEKELINDSSTIKNEIIQFLSERQKNSIFLQHVCYFIRKQDSQLFKSNWKIILQNQQNLNKVQQKVQNLLEQKEQLLLNYYYSELLQENADIYIEKVLNSFVKVKLDIRNQLIEEINNKKEEHQKEQEKLGSEIDKAKFEIDQENNRIEELSENFKEQQNIQQKENERLNNKVNEINILGENIEDEETLQEYEQEVENYQNDRENATKQSELIDQKRQMLNEAINKYNEIVQRNKKKIEQYNKSIQGFKQHFVIIHENIEQIAQDIYKELKKQNDQTQKYDLQIFNYQSQSQRIINNYLHSKPEDQIPKEYHSLIQEAFKTLLQQHRKPENEEIAKNSIIQEFSDSVVQQTMQIAINFLIQKNLDQVQNNNSNN